MGKFVADVLHCGGEWVSLRATRAGVEGLLPLLHPGPQPLPAPGSGPHEMDFQGTYEHSLDAKNRLTIPADLP